MNLWHFVMAVLANQYKCCDNPQDENVGGNDILELSFALGHMPHSKSPTLDLARAWNGSSPGIVVSNISPALSPQSPSFHSLTPTIPFLLPLIETTSPLSPPGQCLPSLPWQSCELVCQKHPLLLRIMLPYLANKSQHLNQCYILSSLLPLQVCQALSEKY